jgi:hypothetical protein
VLKVVYEYSYLRIHDHYFYFIKKIVCVIFRQKTLLEKKIMKIFLGQRSGSGQNRPDPQSDTPLNLFLLTSIQAYLHTFWDYMLAINLSALAFKKNDFLKIICR